MHADSGPHDWKSIVALSAAFISICFGFAACDYVKHRIELEKKMFEAANPTKSETK